MEPTVYGIPNCDTVKKARAWLQERGVAHRFHDFRKDGVPAERLDGWAQALGWDVLLNRRGTTWRKLEPRAQAAADSPAGARQLALDQPSVIKRPVVEWPAGVSAGFDPQAWEAWIQRR